MLEWLVIRHSGQKTNEHFEDIAIVECKEGWRENISESLFLMW
jgi:hypothetical protein